MTLNRGDWYFMLFALVMAVMMSRTYMYVIQQDNYRIREIFSSRRIRSAYLTDLVCIVIFGGAWTGCFFIKSRIFWGFLSSLFFAIAIVALYFVEEAPKKKKPFRYTRRAVRGIASVSLVVTALVTLAVAALNGYVGDEYYRYCLFFVVPPLFPLIFAVTMSVVNVFERLNNSRYERRTARILRENRDLIKIGITGSSGKTSVKRALAAMLETRFNVLATPESYNTPMGIAKTVKRLDATHDIFIAEMGARRRGDIARLMRIVRPSHTVLTTVNNQHLGTFGSREAILKEKLRVLDVRDEDGVCVVNDALAECEKVKADKNANIVLAGSRESSPVQYGDVAVCESGSAFTLHLYGTRVECATALLGVHNIENLTLAAGMAFALGVSPEQIRDAISRIEPTPHRLQLIDGNGIKIIDDTFNSSPDGARRALEVLSLFAGRKVVVTPGLVELGAAEEEENVRLGEELAEVADVIVLVGKRRIRSIAEGTRRAGFEGNIMTFGSLAEAEASFGEILHIGDVLLLLNDLPECYDD